MKSFFKIMVIIGLVSMTATCDWLKLLGWNPTYYDEEWVVEKVEYKNGSKVIEIYIQPKDALNQFIFYGDEKIENSFTFKTICLISSIIFNEEWVSSTIIFISDSILDPAVHKTMQFDTTKVFYKARMEGETSLFTQPAEIWRCRITTPSIDITYLDP